jgi:c-di-GMP-binding flagellar brake protein YcgR
MVQLPPSIKIGASASIEVQTSDGAREYKSRVEDIEAHFLLVSMPSERGEFVVIPTGQYVTLSVTTPSAANLFVEGEVVGRRTQPFPVLVIRPISVESNQQRLFHRVQVRIEPAGFWTWIGEGEPPPTARPETQNGETTWQALNGTIVDVSGGGVGMVSDVELPREAWVQVRFPLPATKEPFEARGRVMVARPRPLAGKAQYQLGVKFEGLDKKEQERLVKANHQHQIEERRRARGL